MIVRVFPGKAMTAGEVLVTLPLPEMDVRLPDLVLAVAEPREIGLYVVILPSGAVRTIGVVMPVEMVETPISSVITVALAELTVTISMVDLRLIGVYVVTTEVPAVSVYSVVNPVGTVMMLEVAKIMV